MARPTSLTDPSGLYFNDPNGTFEQDLSAAVEAARRQQQTTATVGRSEASRAAIQGAALEALPGFLDWYADSGAFFEVQIVSTGAQFSYHTSFHFIGTSQGVLVLQQSSEEALTFVELLAGPSDAQAAARRTADYINGLGVALDIADVGSAARAGWQSGTGGAKPVNAAVNAAPVVARIWATTQAALISGSRCPPGPVAVGRAALGAGVVEGASEALAPDPMIGGYMRSRALGWAADVAGLPGRLVGSEGREDMAPGSSLHEPRVY